jgi:Tfp pilus assembly pilus retraction ATPase PilT
MSIRNLLEQMVGKGASDLHLKAAARRGCGSTAN